MRLLTGDECGLLKEFIPDIAHKKLAQEASASEKPDIVLPVHYDTIQKINNKYGIQRLDAHEVQTRARGVVDMTFLSTTEGDGTGVSFACLRHNGSVEMWQGKSPETAPGTTTTRRRSKFAQYQRLSLSGDIFEATKKQSPIIPSVPVKPLALAMIGDSATTTRRMVASDTHGNLVILQTDLSSVNDANTKPVSILKQFSAFSNTPDNITLTYTKGKVVNTQYASAMAVRPTTSSSSACCHVAIGGRERDIRLFDLETAQAIWKAKNLPPDPQTLLQQPIWPSAMIFVRETSPAASSNNINNNSDCNLLAVGTAFGQVRLYDVRSQPGAAVIRRPIRFTPSPVEGFLEHRITAICQTLKPHEIVVGDTTGDLHALDLRFTGTLNGQHGNKQVNGSTSLGRYVGPAGSIRQLVHHPTLPVMAVVGCDRMLRTYNTRTQKVIDCVYLKQRLNCVLMSPEEGEMGIHGTDDDDENNREGNDDDGDFGDMDQEDVIEDFVDSSDDDGNENDANGNSDSDNDDDDDSVDDDVQVFNHAHSESKDPDGDNDDDDDDDDESSVEDNQKGKTQASKENVQQTHSESPEPESSEEESSDCEDDAPSKKRRRR